MEPIFVISSIMLWALVLFNSLLILALIRRVNSRPLIMDNLRPPEFLEQGDEVPDFVIETLDGRTMTRADYEERKLMMVFVSPDCGSCKDLMPKLQDLYPRAHKASVELLIVSLAEAEATREYADELQFTAPILVASNGTSSLKSDYKVPGVPSYYLIDEQGKVLRAGLFDIEWEKLVLQWV